MKLRNKETGWLTEDIMMDFSEGGGIAIDGKRYDRISDINKEWEDYEEPKDFWFIDEEGDVLTDGEEYIEHLNKMKSIGNYFSTKEEAEKAVRKLKAWKRLKDKGFRFCGYTDDSGDLFSCQVIRCRFDDFGKESRKDLDLLFGDKE